jgi:hypothetical protein
VGGGKPANVEWGWQDRSVIISCINSWVRGLEGCPGPNYVVYQCKSQVKNFRWPVLIGRNSLPLVFQLGPEPAISSWRSYSFSVLKFPIVIIKNVWIGRNCGH